MTNSRLSSLLKHLADPGKRRSSVLLIYDDFAPKFHAWLIRKGVSRHEREDIIQDAFVSLLKHVDKKAKDNREINIEFPKTWLFSIMKNCYNSHKKKRRKKMVEYTDDPESDCCPSLIPPAGENARRLSLALSLEKAFDIFSSRYPLCSQALEYIVIEGVGLKELGVFLGKTYGATRQFVSDCRKRLRTLWKELTS